MLAQIQTYKIEILRPGFNICHISCVIKVINYDIEHVKWIDLPLQVFFWHSKVIQTKHNGVDKNSKAIHKH